MAQEDQQGCKKKTAVRTTQHEEEEDTGVRTARGRGTREQREKQGQKQEIINKIVLEAVIITWVPISATKPIRGPCRAICYHLLPTLVNSGVKCQCCRCLASPSEQLNKTLTKLLESGL